MPVLLIEILFIFVNFTCTILYDAVVSTVIRIYDSTVRKVIIKGVTGRDLSDDFALVTNLACLAQVFYTERMGLNLLE